MIAITRRSFLAAAALLTSAPRHAISAATRPAAQAPLRLVRTRKKDDSVEIAIERDATVLTITCPSGIGDATFERTGPSWGKKFTVRFRYAHDRPFRMLESVGGSLAKDDKPNPAEKDLVYLAVVSDGKKGTAEFTFPANADEYTRLSLDWIDAFRR